MSSTGSFLGILGGAGLVFACGAGVYARWNVRSWIQNHKDAKLLLDDERPPSYLRLQLFAFIIGVLWLLRGTVQMLSAPSLSGPELSSSSSSASSSSSSSSATVDAAPSFSVPPTASTSSMPWHAVFLEISNIALLNAWPYAVFATLSVGRSLQYHNAVSRKQLARFISNIFAALSVIAFLCLMISPSTYFTFCGIGYLAFLLVQLQFFYSFFRALSLMPSTSATVALRAIFLMFLAAIALHCYVNFLKATWPVYFVGASAWPDWLSMLGSLTYALPVIIWVEVLEHEKACKAQTMWNNNNKNTNANPNSHAPLNPAGGNMHLYHHHQHQQQQQHQHLTPHTSINHHMHAPYKDNNLHIC